MTEFVSAEVHGHVVLVPETFTESDRLLISRVTRRGPDGRPLELPACQCIEMPGR